MPGSGGDGVEELCSFRISTGVIRRSVFFSGARPQGVQVECD